MLGKRVLPFSTILLVVVVGCLLSSAGPAFAQLESPGKTSLPDFDKRTSSPPALVTQERMRAFERLRARQPRAQVAFDPITGGVKSIETGPEFLSGTNGVGGAIPAATAAGFAAADPNRATKAFLQEYRDLFRHGAEALDSARVKRESVTPRNGLRTVVWQQQVDGIAVYDAVLISHTGRRGELISLSSQFLPDVTGAVQRGGQSRTNLGASLRYSAAQAVAVAAGQIGEQLSDGQLAPVAGTTAAQGADPERHQSFRAGALEGNADARLVWLPMNADQLRLCWDVILMGRTRGEMFRVLVDTRTGEALVRHCLTADISDATYRVYTSDSPTPFSPGFSVPSTAQPPEVPRSLVTLSALDVNASPAGWIGDGTNETLGNNVDAHTDLSGDDQTDLPRPHGSPFRVFDFPLSLTNPPSMYRDAAVVQLFYWCNWMHDRLYDLGFTEAAGNFQSDNFGRGGLGGDAVLAEAQDGGGFNNANFSTPPDGLPGLMRMYIWNFTTPPRDGDLDAEIILHEYTHGLSNRRVGGGVGITETQSLGMGEGWSDFYALSLLSEASDDVDGNYAEAAYSMYRYAGLPSDNYYFGIRRYPYTTDLSKNPLTFKDIDPNQASTHPGIPRNPAIGGFAAEPHNMGEVWCVTLWDARANLIKKYGWATGNTLMLQLVTDGMELSPPNPSFLQGRDAILQADMVDTGGSNQVELSIAFAKRGMGVGATCPDSSTSFGVQESFDVPDAMQVSPFAAGTYSFQSGEVETPSCQTYVVSNLGSNLLNWSASTADAPWVSVDPLSGTIAPGGSNAVTVCLNSVANTLLGGNYPAVVVFSNAVTGFVQTRSFTLQLSPPELLFFSLDTLPAWSFNGEWQFGPPEGLGGQQNGYPDPAAAATGTNVFGINLAGDYSLMAGAPSYLTAGPFDFFNCTNVSLQFERWLNTDVQPYVYATIEVSSDGTNWSTVWDNGVTEITDKVWTPVSYDISSWADNQTNVYVRWGHRVASSLAFPYSGWNIDDIEFSGNTSQRLTLTIPSAADTSTGGLTGMVTANPAPNTDLIVSLGSSDPTAVGLPDSVTIPAGQSSANFNIAIASQLIGRPHEIVTVTGTAPLYFLDSSSIEVTDTNALALHLSLPAIAAEDEGTVEGALWIRDPQTNALTVSLSSSDPTALQVPNSVTIPAGQTNVGFSVTVGDTMTSAGNNAIDGSQIVVVTADSPGWSEGTGSVSVVSQPVFITAQPTNLAVAVGSNATFTVTAVGAPPLSYQWTFDGTNVLDDTNDTLVLTNVQVSDAGEYAVLVFNAFGFEQSSNAVLSVGEAPLIAMQPTNQTVALGSPAAFGVLATGTGPLLYQWSRDGMDLTDATNSVLSIGSVQSSDAGAYVVRVSNAFGTETSSNAVLTVGLPPLVTGQPTNLAVVIGSNAVFTVTAEGTAPLSYQWTFDGTNVLDDTNDTLVLTNVQVSDAGEYAVLVFNAFGFEQSSNAVLSVGEAPLIAMQPTNQTVALGSPAAFGVLANGTGPLLYQWSRDGMDLADATNSVLSIGSVQSSDAGAYAVLVFNAFGTETSSNAVLVIGQPAFITAQPTNLAIIIGSNAVFTVTAEGTAPLSYQWTFDGTNVLDDTNDTLVLTNVQVSDAGEYAVLVFNAFGFEQSSNAVLSVGEAPLIAVQPTNQTVALGSPAAFGVLATGTGPLLYQWSRDGMDLTDATNSVLSIGSVQSSDAGAYAVRVMNGFGTETSSNAVLTVGLPPLVTGQPTNLAVVIGSNAVFTVTVEGTAPLSYQWTFDGTNVLDDTNDTLVLTNVQVSDAGEYAVLVFNAFGFEQSSNAVLSVGEAPLIAMQPTNQTVALGSPVSFAVSANGTGPLLYQWSRDGMDLTDATNSVLSIGSVQSSDAGAYAVRVFNAFGTEMSSNAVLAIGQPALITAQPTNLAVVIGSNATFTVTVEGTAPLSYQWTFDGTNVLDDTNDTLVLTNVQVSDAGEYAVLVFNAFGFEQSSNAVLSVGEAPLIAMQPTNQTVALGSPAAFGVLATGTGPLLYQWSRDGMDLTGATNSVLSIGSVQLSDAGAYAVRVFNGFGTETSSNAVLTVGLPPLVTGQPTNLAVVVGSNAVFTVTAEGTAPLSYQWTFDGTNVLDDTNDTLVLTNVQVSDAGEYAVLVFNAFGFEQSSNAVLSVGEAPLIAMQPTNETVALGSPVGFAVSANGTGPLLYQWSRDGMDLTDATNSVLSIGSVQSSDSGAYAVRVMNGFGTETSSNAVLTVGLPPLVTRQPTNLAVVIGSNATFTVTVEGTSPLGYQWTFDGTNVLDDTNDTLVLTNVQVSDAGEYAVLVFNAFGFEQSSNAVLSVGEAPLIAMQPTNQTVALGSPAGFAVSANGTGPLFYQWSRDGMDLTDATNSVLAIGSVQSSDAGAYAVRVFNGFGTETSSNAVLTVGLPPLVTGQPTNLAIVIGGNAVFTVTAEGTAPLSYQWTFDGTNVLDDTNDTLVLTNVQVSDAGEYAVLVFNAFGAEQSSNATLFVYGVDHFEWDPIPSPRFVNVPFPVRIQALDASNNLVAGFAGTVALATVADDPIQPSVSGSFTNGEWSGTVTLFQETSGTVLIAEDESGHLGDANPIDVVNLPTLTMQQSGKSLVISWPANAPGFVPEISLDMLSWSPVTSPTDLIGGVYEIRIHLSDTNSFYRLRFPGP